MKKYKKNNHSKLIYICLIAAILLSVAGFFVYKRVNDKNSTTPDAKTTSSAPSAQENFTTGDNRSPASNDSEKGSAVIVDNQGQQTTTPNQSQWTTSKTGEITVYEPAKSQVVAKGAVISGASSTSVVYYRIIDDVSGMITQGQFSVVNGKFSGTLSFNTTAANGRIDVYGADATGKEFGNVEVPIRFK